MIWGSVGRQFYRIDIFTGEPIESSQTNRGAAKGQVRTKRPRPCRVRQESVGTTQVVAQPGLAHQTRMAFDRHRGLHDLGALHLPEGGRRDLEPAQE